MRAIPFRSRAGGLVLASAFLGSLGLLAGCAERQAREVEEALAISRVAVGHVRAELGEPSALAVEFVCTLEPPGEYHPCADAQLQSVADSIARDLGVRVLPQPAPQPCSGTTLEPPACTGGVLTLVRPEVERRTARMILSVWVADLDADQGVYNVHVRDWQLRLERRQGRWRVVSVL